MLDNSNFYERGLLCGSVTCRSIGLRPQVHHLYIKLCNFYIKLRKCGSEMLWLSPQVHDGKSRRTRLWLWRDIIRGCGTHSFKDVPPSNAFSGTHQVLHRRPRAHQLAAVTFSHYDSSLPHNTMTHQLAGVTFSRSPWQPAHPRSPPHQCPCPHPCSYSLSEALQLPTR